jgi:hypothetical protein
MKVNTYDRLPVFSQLPCEGEHPVLGYSGLISTTGSKRERFITGTLRCKGETDVLCSLFFEVLASPWSHSFSDPLLRSKSPRAGIIVPSRDRGLRSFAAPRVPLTRVFSAGVQAVERAGG